MISVHEMENLSLQQIEKLLVAAEEARFEASERKQLYGWIERSLCQQEYARQGRRERIEANRCIVDQVAAHTRSKAVLLALLTCVADPSFRAASARALRDHSFLEFRTDRPTAGLP